MPQHSLALVILSDRSAAKGVEGPAFVFVSASAFRALYQGTILIVPQMLHN
jgi:hypothetical protein